MTIEEMQKLADRYQDRFGNLDEIIHPGFMTDPEFLRLLNTAIERGTSLTRAELEQAFPDFPWEGEY